MFGQNDKIIIALSGGSDSVLLLHFLEKLRPEFNFTLLAVHVHHGLRGAEADRDMDFCTGLCGRLGIEIETKFVDVRSHRSETGASMEMAARELRYAVLKDTRRDRGFTSIATGHNMDDNAETVLLNLVKGKGPDALAGIPVRRGVVIRPMLALKKEEIEGWLAKHDLSWVEDSSNRDTEIQRNLIRRKVIPLLKEINPALNEAILGNSEMMRSLLGSVPDAHGCTSIDPGGRIVVDTTKARELTDYSLYREISIRLIENFQLNLKFQIFNSLKKLIVAQPGRKTDLGAGVSAFRERDAIVIGLLSGAVRHGPVELSPGEVVAFGKYLISCTEAENFVKSGDKKVALIDAEKIEGVLAVRVASAGDWFYPLNGKGKRKISDFFNDIKLESSEKWSHPVIFDSENLVWVCGLRPDERYKVTDKSKKIYKLEIREHGQNND